MGQIGEYSERSCWGRFGNYSVPHHAAVRFEPRRRPLEASAQAEPMRRLQSGARKMAPVARPLAGMSAQTRHLVPLAAEASMCVTQPASGVSSGT